MGTCQVLSQCEGCQADEVTCTSATELELLKVVAELAEDNLLCSVSLKAWVEAPMCKKEICAMCTTPRGHV